MSSITGLKIPPCWLGMFPSDAFPIQSADLVSAGAALLWHNAGAAEVQHSLWSSTGTILHLLKSGPCSPPPAFPAGPKGTNDSKCEFPASSPGWGSPEAPRAGGRWTEPESLTGSSSVLLWGETRGGKGHWPELLLDTEKRRDNNGQKALLAVEAGPCHTQVLSWTPSQRLSGTRSCP